MIYLEKEYLDFFNELSENNSKIWFDENRKRYEKFVKKPFENLITDLIAELNLIDLKITMQTKDALFRINRDIRFSKDKTPYKTHLSAFISAGGKKDNAYPGYYIQIGNEGIALAGGIYQADKDIIQKFRTYIANNLDEFQKLTNDKNFKKYFNTLQGEKSKLIPKDFKEIVSKEPLLANKQLYYWVEIEKKYVYANNIKEIILEYFNSAEKMKSFLTEAIS